ncbi:MAG: hypothetical protein EBZ78_11780 [Verrucomicrobia bacterium]|nr:hypothetical protein [Verrucomicrobiota bacterium]
MGLFEKYFYRFFILSALFFSEVCHAQRICLPPTPDSSPPIVSTNSPPDSMAASPASDSALVLKSYPDGTKKIVPLEALNFRDNGEAFGGPPKLSLVPGPANSLTVVPQKSPERLSVAPIGNDETASMVSANLPASVDPTAGATMMGRSHGRRLRIQSHGGRFCPRPCGSVVRLRKIRTPPPNRFRQTRPHRGRHHHGSAGSLG